MRKEAEAAHELVQLRMKERRTVTFKPFIKGQKVWLEATHLRFIKDNKKLAAKRHGPFPIAEVVSPWAYRLKLPDQWRIHPVFHASLLTPYHENETHGPNFIRPPPDIVEGEEEYEVETIIDINQVMGTGTGNSWSSGRVTHEAKQLGNP